KNETFSFYRHRRLIRTLPEGSAMAGIGVRDVRKTFGQTTGLDGVSLDVDPGEFFSLIGPSGCGKTTLLRIIAGLEHQDSGSIHLGGESVDALSPKQRNV